MLAMVRVYKWDFADQPILRWLMSTHQNSMVINEGSSYEAGKNKVRMFQDISLKGLISFDDIQEMPMPQPK